MYAICIRNSYKIHTCNCMQNVSPMSTYFEPFVLNFLTQNSNLKLAG